MSIEQTDVVDRAILDTDSGDIILNIIDDASWAHEAERHMYLLQEKVNSYLSYVETGQMTSELPDSAGRKVRIMMLFKHEPTESGLRFIARMRHILNRGGYLLDFKHIDA